jgi:hypothetical protein
VKDQAALRRALARHKLQQKRARPTAKAAYKALTEGGELPDVPEYAGGLPDAYPYCSLPEREGRQLAFLANALPEKAAELQGLWLTGK